MMYTTIEEKSFLNWMRQTNQLFSGSEYQLRLGIFLSNTRFVQSHNAANKGFHVTLNKFSAMTPFEYRSLLTFKPRSTFAEGDFQVTDVESIDWRKKGCVNEVKDQGTCGSCWAFSMTQCAEGDYAAKFGTLFSLSTQQLVDCVEVAWGCEGGHPPDVWAWLLFKKIGFMDESTYPYTGHDDPCKYDASKTVLEIKGFRQITAFNEKELADKVAAFGPHSCGIDASNLSFQLYSSGIYDEPACSPVYLNFGVGCVGFGKEGHNPYWIMRNSWGKDWGEAGYIRMIKDKENQCGAASDASYVRF